MLTEGQLKARLLYVCGSDSSVIAGINPYKTKLQLWQEKTRRIQAEDIGHLNHIKFGNFFENGVAEWFQSESGKKFQPQSEEMLIHPTIPYLAGNPDRIIQGENAILECKTAFDDKGWGNGENIIPPNYLLQVAHYCAVGNFDRAYIAVVFYSKQ